MMLVSGHLVLGAVASAFEPVDQQYLDQARQMQALSFAAHIPLVASESHSRRWCCSSSGATGRRVTSSTGPAKRWSKVMLALFAVGVVTGTILSFEMGLLWPNFMTTFGEAFGVAFALEGFSFFLEAIFIAIYVYGWDRLRPRAHFLAGIPS